MGNLLLQTVTLVLFCAFFYMLSDRDLFAPPIIMALMFIVSSLFALLNVNNWNIDYLFTSYMYIVTGIIVFFIPYFIISNENKREISMQIKYRRICISKGKWLVIILIDLVILLLYWNEVRSIVRGAGYFGTQIQWYFRNITSLEGTRSVSYSVRFLVKIIDVSAFIGSYVFINNAIIFKDSKLNNLIYIIPSAFFSIKALMGGGRQDLLKLISYCIVCAYILSHNAKGWDTNISQKFIRIGIMTFVIAMPGFYYALNFTGRTTTRTMFQMISTYVGGSIQHFNQYVQDPIEKSPFFGNECFTPILNTLDSMGIIDYHNTVHLEFRRLGITKGNIYTFFRRPLQDFGIGGMYIFTMLVSTFFSTFYCKYIKRTFFSLKNDLLTMIYSYLFYWIVLSSIEQYSMTIISVQTILIILIFHIMWRFLVTLEFNKMKIKVKSWNSIC